MKQAVIITAQGFQDEEYIYPYYRLLEAGVRVDVATQDGQTVYGKYGNPAKANKKTSELLNTPYDLALIPGGFEAPDRVRVMPEVLAFLKDMDQKKKWIAAICHGPWVLISAEIVRNRKMTAYWSMEADVKNSGAIYCHKEPVVVDQNLITSPHYQYNPEFMRAVIASLG